MDAFNFTFSLLGLVLGFALVELLSRLVRLMDARRRVTVGFLTPAMAIFVMMDLLSWWSTLWQFRAAIPATYGALLYGLVASSIYYFAASRIIPDTLSDRAVLDDHYLGIRRFVFGTVGALSFVTMCALIVVSGQRLPIVQIVSNIVYFGAMIVAVLSSSERINGVCLATLITTYLLWAFVA